MSNILSASELILNPDGSIYHLNIKPSQLAHDIITVGDPDRVGIVGKHLDNVEIDVQKREFRTITGSRAGKRWTIISTGIGTDNIDIVFNELDALVNVNLEQRSINEKPTSLRFYRLGTSGTLRSDINVDQFLASAYGVGLGGLLHFYKKAPSHQVLSQKINKTLDMAGIPVQAYASAGSESLLNQLDDRFLKGITYTAPGFYGPQGRSIRLAAQSDNYLDTLSQIEYQGIPSTNLEMETAGIYGLANLLGHQAISLNAILANRVTGEFSKDPNKIVEKMVKVFFELFG